jgi:hypothetical protein
MLQNSHLELELVKEPSWKQIKWQIILSLPHSRNEFELSTLIGVDLLPSPWLHPWLMVILNTLT